MPKVYTYLERSGQMSTLQVRYTIDRTAIVSLRASFEEIDRLGPESLCLYFHQADLSSPEAWPTLSELVVPFLDKGRRLIIAGLSKAEQKQVPKGIRTRAQFCKDDAAARVLPARKPDTSRSRAPVAAQARAPRDEVAEVLEHLRQRIGAAARGGFDSLQSVIEEIPEWLEGELDEVPKKLATELVHHARTCFEEQAALEGTWHGPTANDRIDASFDALNASGIIALQDAGITMQDGWSIANERAGSMDPPPRGATFFHRQDVEGALSGRGLYLTYGAYEADDAKHAAASAAIGHEVCRVLMQHGVDSVWDGSIATRIQISPFEWRKRRNR